MHSEQCPFHTVPRSVAISKSSLSLSLLSSLKSKPQACYQVTGHILSFTHTFATARRLHKMVCGKAMEKAVEHVMEHVMKTVMENAVQIVMENRWKPCWKPC